MNDMVISSIRLNSFHFLLFNCFEMLFRKLEWRDLSRAHVLKLVCVSTEAKDCMLQRTYCNTASIVNCRSDFSMGGHKVLLFGLNYPDPILVNSFLFKVIDPSN